MTTIINDCPACGTSLNCSGCGEDIQNIVEQSALLKEKDAEIAALKNKNEELQIDLSVQWGRGDVLAKEIEELKAKIHRMSKCFYFWDQYEGQYRGQNEA